MDMTQMINGSWIIAGAMKATGESTKSKRFRLKVKFDQVSLESVIFKALEPTKIQWVNGQGRKHYDSFTENQLIEIDFKSPARAPQIDPKEAVIAELAAMTPEEMKVELEGMLAEAKAQAK